MQISEMRGSFRDSPWPELGQKDTAAWDPGRRNDGCSLEPRDLKALRLNIARKSPGIANRYPGLRGRFDGKGRVLGVRPVSLW
jgi:hypothetical protein